MESHDNCRSLEVGHTDIGLERNPRGVLLLFVKISKKPEISFPSTLQIENRFAEGFQAGVVPKLGAACSGVPMMTIIGFWGLYWDPIFWQPHVNLGEGYGPTQACP